MDTDEQPPAVRILEGRPPCRPMQNKPPATDYADLGSVFLSSVPCFLSSASCLLFPAFLSPVPCLLTPAPGFGLAARAGGW